MLNSIPKQLPALRRVAAPVASRSSSCILSGPDACEPRKQATMHEVPPHKTFPDL